MTTDTKIQISRPFGPWTVTIGDHVGIYRSAYIVGAPAPWLVVNLETFQVSDVNGPVAKGSTLREALTLSEDHIRNTYELSPL